MQQATRQWIGWIVGFAVLASLVPSCIDRVDLPIRHEKPVLVVEGQITNEAPPYLVRLTYSNPFRYTGELPAEALARNAQVRLSDDAGRSTSLREILGRPSYYQTVDSTFVGQPGRIYTLSIALSDGKRYVSQPERMQAVPPIDTIYTDVARLNLTTDPFRYMVYVDAQDPAQTENYYRWTATTYSVRLSTGVPCALGSSALCYDKCWIPFYHRSLNIFSDQGINGNSIKKRLVAQSPIYALGPHAMEIKQYSLSRQAYQFLRSFQEQQSRVGSIFDPLPTSIIGNIVNADDEKDHVLGYFSASAVTTKRLKEFKDESSRGNLRSYLATLIPQQGDCRYLFASEGAFLLQYEPPGF
ncbi:DUF4249 domain-containing protein [Tellurirhabdus bombi]|uniref:DUF4249 domain-containing protein n=1 Tax=Tellurirhabdus bombi TaxID=2907205 RepID=UPI001F274D7F|nr:DUF4249 domain-containing protein [Tellurirhabdus bombi]